MTMYLCTGLFLTGCMTSGSNACLLLCLGSCKLYLYKSGIISVSDAGFCPDFLTGGWQKFAHANKWFPEGGCSGSDSYEKTCGAPGFSFPWRLFETIYWDKAEPYLSGDKSRCSTTIQLQCISMLSWLESSFPYYLVISTKNIFYTQDTQSKQVMAPAHVKGTSSNAKTHKEVKETQKSLHETSF